jgi:hypothetical protein
MTADAAVAVVGGGPAGCSAALFTARYGLETIVFDRGRSSLAECAHLENYLGFPAGIDVETAYDLAHEHVRTAGGTIHTALVERVEPAADGLALTTDEGNRHTAATVVAATRYDGAYLEPALGSDAVGDADVLDPAVVDDDGGTAVDGLYVATPAGERDEQAIEAAGRGARVARTLLADWRHDQGLPDAVATHRDWARREDRLTEEWADRERWDAWFDERLPADAAVDAATRTAEIDRIRASYLTAEERDAKRHDAHRRLAAALDTDAVLEALDDDRIRAYLAETTT